MDDKERNEILMNSTAHEIDRLIPLWGGPTNQYPTLGGYLTERLHAMRFLRSPAELATRVSRDC